MLWQRNSRASVVPPPSSLTGDWRQVGRDGCYVLLMTLLWLAGNLLGILGCVVAMFLVISHGDVSTFFLHIDNLASRYVAADSGRRTLFAHELVQLLALVLVIAIAVRGPLFVSRLRRDLRQGRPV